MKFTIDNVYVTIEFTEPKKVVDEFEKMIHETIDPLDPNRFRNKAFRIHVWDGRVKHYDFKNKRFPVGLMNDVKEQFGKLQLSYPDTKLFIEDTRSKPIRPKEIPDEIILKDTPKGDIVLNADEDNKWNFQYKAIQEVLNNQTMIVNGSTNMGKTVVAAGFIQEDLKQLNNNEMIFFVSGSVNLAQQTQKRLENDLHIPVGFWGNGKCQLHQVNSVMARTLYMALQDPAKKVELTSQKDKNLKHLVQDFLPHFKVPNAKLTIRNFLRMNQPKYKYQEDIFDTLSQLVTSRLSNEDVIKVLDSYQDKYDKLIRSKNKKVFDKYDFAVKTLEQVKVVIVDECHNATSDSYQIPLSYMTNARQRIGLSGTINTKDILKWTTLKGTFSDRLFKVSNDDLIKREISAKPLIKFIPIYEPKDLDALAAKEIPVAMNANSAAIMQYQAVYRLGITENDYRNNIIANLAAKLSQQKKGVTLIVVNSVDHGKRVQDILNKMNIANAYMHGEVSPEDREDILRRTKANELSVLIGTSVVDEGLDIATLKYLIYASGGKSFRAVLQRIGRVLRISDKKQSTVIFDLEDRTHKLLYKQAQTRRKIYKEEKFEILD